MPLLNVRLSIEDARAAAALREAGIPISTLVREAIRAEYTRRIAPAPRGRSPSRIVAEILASLPDPDGLPPRSFDIADRLAVRGHIVKKLARRPKK